MPDWQKTIALIRADEDEARQERLITKYCTEHHLRLVVRASTPQAAAQSVAAGEVDIVVAVSDRRDGLRHLIAVAGGTVRFVRERRRPPTVREWLAKAIGRGITPSAIGQHVGEDTEEIIRIMREYGIKPPPDEPQS